MSTPPPNRVRDRDPRLPSEELRLAVVLNGGVSLAVWMGGVCAEINDLTNGAGVYGQLLELLQADARVDVIAGTSAGGINGAFLALGQAYEGAKLDTMLELWADRGSFEALLRNPTRGDHDSLLRGNDYFLPELRKAFEGVVNGCEMRPSDARPVDLFLTCTDLKGELRPFVDALGQTLWEVEHTGLFRFSRTPREARLRRDGDDLARDAQVARRLALAARSTASFPGAFEPVFVPVREEAATGPDMDGFATFTQSRFVVDGGVLQNEPIAPALAAIWRLPAEAQVRRVLLYVNPDPAPPRAAEPARPSKPPPLRDVVIASVTRLTIQQGVHEQLKAIQDSNRKARLLKDARPDLIAALPVDLAPAQEKAAFDRYCERRAQHTASRLAQIVVEEWYRTAFAKWNEERAGSARPEPADADAALLRRRHNLETALEKALGVDRRDEQTGEYDLPWVPRKLAGPEEDEDWRWGLSPVERLVAFTLDQLKRAQAIANRPPSASDGDLRGEARKALRQARGECHRQLAILRSIRRAEDAYWRAWAKEAHSTLDSLADTGDTGTDEFRKALASAIDDVIEETETMALAEEGKEKTANRDHLRKTTIAVVTLRQLAVAAKVVDDLGLTDDEECRRLGETLQGLAGTSTHFRNAFDEDRNSIVRRLLLAEVYVSLAGLDRPAEEQQEVALALVSGHARARWARHALSPEEKIAGLKLAHFGAFYKRSWRVNDWFWGRVDGAIRLCELLLRPERLWQLGCTRAQLEQALRAARLDDALADPLVCKELDAYEAQRVGPARQRHLQRLEHTAAWFATARHREVIDRKAIDDLVDACKEDVRRDASPRANGAIWAFRKREPATGENFWLDQLDRARVGAETLDGELGTDQLSRTVATVSANVTAVLKDERSGLGALKEPLRALHGLTLLFYAFVTSWTGGKIGAALTNLGLASGGALVALGVVAPNMPGWVTSAGAAVLLAGVTAAAIRSRLRSIAVIAGPVVLFLVLHQLVFARGHTAELPAPVIVVLTVIIGAWVLGFAAEPEGIPGLRHVWALVKAMLTIVAFVAAGWAALRIDPWATGLLHRLHEQRPLLWGFVVEKGGLVLGVGVGLSVGWWLMGDYLPRRFKWTWGHPDAEHAFAWLPLYGALFGLAGVALVAYQLEHWEFPIPPTIHAALATFAATWAVLTIAWPIVIALTLGVAGKWSKGDAALD